MSLVWRKIAVHISTFWLDIFCRFYSTCKRTWDLFKANPTAATMPIQEIILGKERHDFSFFCSPHEPDHTCSKPNYKHNEYPASKDQPNAFTWWLFINTLLYNISIVHIFLIQGLLEILRALIELFRYKSITITIDFFSLNPHVFNDYILSSSLFINYLMHSVHLLCHMYIVYRARRALFHIIYKVNTLLTVNRQMKCWWEVLYVTLKVTQC